MVEAKSILGRPPSGAPRRRPQSHDARSLAKFDRPLLGVGRFGQFLLDARAKSWLTGISVRIRNAGGRS